MLFGKSSGAGTPSLFQAMKMKFWQSVIKSNFCSAIMQILIYAALAFSSTCFCFSWLYGSSIFTWVSFLASVMIMLNIDLTNLNRKYQEYADLYSSMDGIKNDLADSNAALKENNAQLKQEVWQLQSKIKKLEGLLLGMEKVINNSHELNKEQTAKFTEALNNIIEAADLSNANAQAEFAKVLLDYENVSDKLAAVTATLELKTAELANTSAALCDSNKDFKKVCKSLEIITLRLEQLYSVGVISEKYLNTWSMQLKVSASGGGETYVKSAEIKQNFMGLQSFCDSLGTMPRRVPEPHAAA